MTRLLTMLFGRLPIGWLQLSGNRNRFAAALAGVAFANVLVFMQLGFLGALLESVKLPYRLLDGEILVSASDANTLSDGSHLPRRRMYQALSTPGVADAAPLYLGQLDWERENGDSIGLHVFGIDPRRPALDSPALRANLDRLKQLDVALIDRRSRNVERAFFDRIDAGSSFRFEGNGRTLDVVGAIEVGAGFEADGYMVVSDETFGKLFPRSSPGTPRHVVVKVEPGADPAAVVRLLREDLSGSDTQVRTTARASEVDVAYQSRERPVGVVFGFGVVIGVVVGVIIVYQILSTDVTDHLAEYATFKAIGYPERFFLGIVFEEALVLALLGFVPGLLLALVLYAGVSAATGLPVVMTGLRPFGVLLGTLAMCTASGAIATRRLAAADPADLF